MTWELREVSDIDCTMDDSGVYVVVNRVEDVSVHKGRTGTRVRVRADLMTAGTDDGPPMNDPIMSFIGSANNVRKHLIHFIHDYVNGVNRYLSTEHASYIGYELHRAESDPSYVQD